MTAEQLALDCEGDWSDADLLDDDEPRLPPDLEGQHIPDGAHIDDIPLTGRYL